MRPSSSVDKDMNRLPVVVVFLNVHAVEDIVGCDDAVDFVLSLIAVELSVEVVVDIELNLLVCGVDHAAADRSMMKYTRKLVFMADP